MKGDSNKQIERIIEGTELLFFHRYMTISFNTNMFFNVYMYYVLQAGPGFLMNLTAVFVCVDKLRKTPTRRLSWVFC